MDVVEHELLTAIAADVDAVEPRLVYADWLQTRGDPRGELAILEHRLASRPHDFILRARWSALQAGVQAGVRAGLTSDVIGPWRYGFVDAITLDRHLLRHVRAAPGWFEHPALRFVRSLHQAVTDVRAWEVVATWHHRGSLRTLRHGTVQKEVEWPTLAAIAKLLPAITSLDLRSANVPSLEPLANLPLTSLRVDAATLERGGKLRSAPSQLTRLAIRAPTIELASVAALLDGTWLPTVRHLELSGVSALAVVERLASSGRLATLDSLSLPFHSLLGDERVQLASHREALTSVHLEVPLAGSFSDGWHRCALGEVLSETLHRPAEALALFDAEFRWNDSDARVGYAAALRRLGDRERMLETFDRAKRAGYHGGTYDDRAELELSDALLVDNHDPALVEIRARALLLLGRTGDAIKAADQAPPSDTTRLVRALASRRARDDKAAARELAELVRTTSRASYVALAWLLEDRFALHVPASCIACDRTLAAIVSAAGLPAEQPASEDLECAEIAIVAAVHAGDLALAATRARALGDVLDDRRRRWNHDLRAAFAMLPLGEPARSFVSALVHATRDYMQREALAELSAHYLESAR